MSIRSCPWHWVYSVALFICWPEAASPTLEITWFEKNSKFSSVFHSKHNLCPWHVCWPGKTREIYGFLRSLSHHVSVLTAVHQACLSLMTLAGKVSGLLASWTHTKLNKAANVTTTWPCSSPSSFSRKNKWQTFKFQSLMLTVNNESERAEATRTTRHERGERERDK